MIAGVESVPSGFTIKLAVTFPETPLETASSGYFICLISQSLNDACPSPWKVGESSGFILGYGGLSPISIAFSRVIISYPPFLPCSPYFSRPSFAEKDFTIPHLWPRSLLIWGKDLSVKTPSTKMAFCGFSCCYRWFLFRGFYHYDFHFRGKGWFKFLS